MFKAVMKYEAPDLSLHDTREKALEASESMLAKQLERLIERHADDGFKARRDIFNMILSMIDDKERLLKQLKRIVDILEYGNDETETERAMREALD